MALVLALEIIPLPREVQAIEHAEFLESGGDWQEVALPDNWRSAPSRTMLPGAYRFSLSELGTSNESLAIYIPNFSGQLSVSVGDLDLSQGGILSGELVPDQSMPYFSPIPSSVLTDDATILLNLTPGGQLKGFLGPVYIGPESALRTSYAWYFFRAVQLPALVVVWQVLLALLLSILWINRRQELAALYGSLILVVSAIHSVPVYMPTSLALAAFATELGLVLNLWLTVLGLLFAYALCERRFPFRLRWIFLPPVLASIAYIGLPAQIFEFVNLALVVPFNLVLVVWIVRVLLHGAFIERRRDVLIILLSIGASLIAVLHDILVLSNVLETSNFLHFRVVFILILPAMSVLFFRRLVNSLNDVDDLVQTLEERIKVAEDNFRTSYEKQRGIERERALSAERQRIMRDVHDGLGGQLASIIAMSRLGETDPVKIEQSAEAALDDLRLLIGSLNVENDITGLLGAFRERAQQQLSAHGIELVWRMIDIPELVGLNPSQALNIVRIMQEATTNAAKHSGTDRVTISFELDNDETRSLRIIIQDNGTGWSDNLGGGYGLQNMKARAEDLGGSVDVDEVAPGLRVTLRVPTKRG